MQLRNVSHPGGIIILFLQQAHRILKRALSTILHIDTVLFFFLYKMFTNVQNGIDYVISA